MTFYVKMKMTGLHLKDTANSIVLKWYSTIKIAQSIWIIPLNGKYVIKT